LGPVKHADGWPGRGVKRLQCLSDLTLANREFSRASPWSGPGGQPQAMLARVALEVKEGLARQALFPVRRAEAARSNIIRVSGLLLQISLLKSKEKPNCGSRPAGEVLYFCFAKRKYPKKRRPAARRIPAPAAPPKARLNSHRATVTALKHAAA
ncbi:hypothetical protein, partial [Aquitalea sp. LB_tupeE]|uniref:hypothetical protein n=1 Tax=Aquitalea sp. LB_tupeE TaxID=2748078 RepID=UPI001C4C05CE